MLKEDRIKMLLLPKRYPCLDKFIIILFYSSINALVVLGIMMCIQSLAIAFHALVDLNVLMSYLQTDYNVLFWSSVLTIICGSLGLLSAFQYSKSGLLTSIGLIIITFFIIDGYAISFRVKNYLSEAQLVTILYDAIAINPYENFQFHFMQRQLSCCGVMHYSDWTTYHDAIPGSCCNNMTICDDDDPTLYKNNCSEVIYEILSNIYQATVDTIIILNVCFVFSLFSGYFYWYLLRQLKKTKKISFHPLPRINMPTISSNQLNQHGYMINTNTILSGNNALQNYNYEYYNAYATNANNNLAEQTRHVQISENLTINENNDTVQEKASTTEEEVNTPQEEVANTPQEEVANTPQEEVANTPQEEVTNTPQESIYTPPEEINKPQEEEVANTPQEEHNTIVTKNVAFYDITKPKAPSIDGVFFTLPTPIPKT
ncbi:PREDICTED: uncharacterized protein LOC107067041 [Polistes dominula]|uniref:Uncharacterized protein LOC107067041 n=1 Tax=Polistes dominula TaxID=743375 RepID=A0ABM1IBV2_POLDO|nr:PREDICTED: uncharacterized protein LOC107067041 [Polistes dominula]